MVKLLVPEEDHLVPVQRIGQAANGGLIEWLGEVDAVDVGTDVAGDRADGQFDALGGDGHCEIPR
jgi:hypothetical protein